MTLKIFPSNYKYYMVKRVQQSVMCQTQTVIVIEVLCQYLDGSVHVGFLAAIVQQPGNSDTVRQQIDEGNIVDEVLCFSNTKYDNGGSTLKIRAKHDCYHL